MNNSVATTWGDWENGSGVVGDIAQLGCAMDGWCKGDGGGNVDSVVSDPESDSDGNRQIVHACLVGEGLEIPCEGREKVGDTSSRNTTWWEGCLIRAARQVGG